MLEKIKAKISKKTPEEQLEEIQKKEEIKTILEKMSVEEFPRDLYYRLKDSWLKSLRIDELFTPDETVGGFMTYVPLIAAGLSAITLIILLFKK